MTDSLHHDVSVAADPGAAYSAFTDRIDQWWPGEYSVLGEGDLHFEDDHLLERKGDAQAIWASVTTADPPDKLVLSWHPGVTAERATEVAIEFTAEAGGTRVSVTQSGFDGVENARATATEFDQDWPAVLAAYADSFDRT